MTDATLYTIKARAQSVGPMAQMDNFTLDDGQPVASQIVIDEPTWSLYSFDHQKRTAAFVDLPPEVDLSQAVFIYNDQLQQARRLLEVPYDALAGLSSQITPPKKLVLIFNMPRAGTTLVSRMFNAVKNAWSLSEPDAHTLASELPRPAHEDDIRYLIEHATRLIFRPPSGSQADTLVLKFRSQGLLIADLFYQVFPDASYLFLYRDALGWGDSVYRFTWKIMGQQPVFNLAFAQYWWGLLGIQDGETLLKNLTGHDLDAVTIEEFTAVMYAIICEKYRSLLQKGVPFYAIRYNDLNQNRETETVNMLAHCGLPVESLPDVLRVFDKDSQAGTEIARDIAAPPYNDAQKARFLATLARHPHFHDPDLLLPDVAHPERMS